MSYTPAHNPIAEPEIIERDGKPIPMPPWAKPRTGDWYYVGWIRAQNNTIIGTKYTELVQRALHSDHEQERSIDEYPEGAACWCRERNK